MTQLSGDTTYYNELANNHQRLADLYRAASYTCHSHSDSSRADGLTGCFPIGETLGSLHPVLLAEHFGKLDYVKADTICITDGHLFYEYEDGYSVKYVASKQHSDLRDIYAYVVLTNDRITNNNIGISNGSDDPH